MAFKTHFSNVDSSICWVLDWCSTNVLVIVWSRHRHSILEAQISDIRGPDILYSMPRDPIFESSRYDIQGIESRYSKHRDQYISPSPPGDILVSMLWVSDLLALSIGSLWLEHRMSMLWISDLHQIYVESSSANRSSIFVLSPQWFINMDDFLKLSRLLCANPDAALRANVQEYHAWRPHADCVARHRPMQRFNQTMLEYGTLMLCVVAGINPFHTEELHKGCANS